MVWTIISLSKWPVITLSSLPIYPSTICDFPLRRRAEVKVQSPDMRFVVPFMRHDYTPQHTMTSEPHASVRHPMRCVASNRYTFWFRVERKLIVTSDADDNA